MLRLLFASLSSCSFPIISHIVKTPFHVKYILYVLGGASMLYHYNCELRELFKIDNDDIQNNFDNLQLYFECLDGIAITLLSNSFFWKGNYYLFPIQIFTVSSYIFSKLFYNSDIIKQIMYVFSTQHLAWKYPINSISLILGLFGYADFCMNNHIWKMPSRYIWHVGNACFIGSCMCHFYD